MKFQMNQYAYVIKFYSLIANNNDIRPPKQIHIYIYTGISTIGVNVIITYAHSIYIVYIYILHTNLYTYTRILKCILCACVYTCLFAYCLNL